MSASYHDLYITTSSLLRTSIFDLPYGLMVTCTRVGGWELWDGETLLASEFGNNGLRLDVNGYVLVDSLEK